MLFFDMDKEYKLSKEHSVDIETILNQTNIQLKCDYCKNTVISQIKFITFPKILIIGFKPKSDNNVIFEYTEQIDLKNKKNNFKYEIISLIIKKNVTFVTYIKSPTEGNIWYEYIDDIKSEPRKIANFNEIKTLKNMPYLLVYQLIQKVQYEK